MEARALFTISTLSGASGRIGQKLPFADTLRTLPLYRYSAVLAGFRMRRSTLHNKNQIAFNYACKLPTFLVLKKCLIVSQQIHHFLRSVSKHYEKIKLLAGNSDVPVRLEIQQQLEQAVNELDATSKAAGSTHPNNCKINSLITGAVHSLQNLVNCKACRISSL